MTGQEEIGFARTLYYLHGNEIRRHTEAGSRLAACREAIAKTQESMKAAGVASSCALCAGQEKGGCCFPGVEEWYDRVLLFANLLMGIDLPESQEIPGACLFVGSQGCKLLARHSFCVNYLCPSLMPLLGSHCSSRLLVATGRELLLGWELECYLRRWLEYRGGYDRTRSYPMRKSNRGSG